jgi:hypothetical protein
MEHLLQYAWMHKIFPLKPLQTTEGTPIEIIDPGLLNHDAGPDFFNAKIKIGHTLWVGNVEVHTASSDWYRHGHDKDKVYDTIILHVTGNPDCEILRPDGQPIPQFQLKCPEQVRLHYTELCKADYYPRCHHIIPKLPTLTVHSWLTSLQIERLEQKTNAIRDRVERCNGLWDDAFFITLARNLGFGLNGDTFERWAGRLPLRAIDKHRDDLMQVEAFFFGTAGLLEETSGDDYYTALRKEYLYLSHKFKITAPMDASLWRLFRLRPNNFYHVRIAQLAALYHQSRSLFSYLMDAMLPVDVCKLLDVETSAYWDTHFSFTHSSPANRKKWGANAMHLIIINTLVPFLYAYGKHKGNESLCERAIGFLSELKSEENMIIRQWKDAGLTVENAADSQALIQLRKEYCDKKNCLHCRFGYEYLRSN